MKNQIWLCQITQSDHKVLVQTAQGRSYKGSSHQTRKKEVKKLSMLGRGSSRGKAAMQGEEEEREREKRKREWRETERGAVVRKRK